METQQGDISIKTTLNCNFFSENPWGCLQAVIRVLWVTHKGNSKTDKMKDTRRWNGKRKGIYGEGRGFSCFLEELDG